MRRLAVAAGSTALTALAVLGLPGCAPTTAPVGIFVVRKPDGRPVYTADDVVTEADALGARYGRVEQKVGAAPDPELPAFRKAGITPLIVAKSPTYAKLPPDLDAYEADLRRVLRAHPTPLLAVQNEEAVAKFWTDTPEHYLDLLRAATGVAHGLDTPVTNGGLDRPMIGLITWNHLRLTKGTAAADAFLDVAFDMTPSIQRGLRGLSPSDPDPYAHVPAAFADRWKETQFLLDAYGSDPGDVPIDYVNFHWYVSDSSAEGFRDTGAYTDTDALRDVVRTVEDLTGKPAVTNELGQWGTSPLAPKRFLPLLVDELHLPFVVWFDTDGVPAHGLHEFGQAGDLRANGVTFRNFLRQH